MKAIILAGGFGTRLQSVLPDTPKPLAPILNKPFLGYVLDYLILKNFSSVVLSLHYQAEKFQHYFQDNYKNLAIKYAVEEKPLGTGGAIRHALSFIDSNDPVFVLNGDTFMPLDYKKMYQSHLNHQAHLSIALRKVENCERYGNVTVSEERIQKFNEKGQSGAGFINAGIYLLKPDLFNSFSLPATFSIEKDFFHCFVDKLKAHAFKANDYFIDIGIPADYERAKRELIQFFSIQDHPT